MKSLSEIFGERKKPLRDVFGRVEKQKPSMGITGMGGAGVSTRMKTTTDIGKGERGLPEKIAEQVVEPFLKTTSAILSAGRGLGMMGKAGFQYMGGNKQAALETMLRAKEGISMPNIFGGEDITPPQGTTMELALDAFGTGIELGTYIIGPSGVGAIYKQSVKALIWQAMKTGAKWGAVEGGAQAFGEGMQDLPSPEEIGWKQWGKELGMRTLGGTAAGGVLGGALGGILAAGQSIWNYVRQGGKQFIRESVEEVSEVVGEKITRVSKTPDGQVTIESVSLKKQPKNVQQAVRTGIDDADINLITNASREDKKVFAEMMNLQESAMGTRKITKRPVTVAGESIIERVKYVADARVNIGEAIGDTVKYMPTEPIDTALSYNKFYSEITGAGVTVDLKGQLDFSASRFADNTSVKKNIQSLFNDLKVTKKTPQEIYILTQKWGDNLYSGRSQQVLTPYSDWLIEQTRWGLKEPLYQFGNFRELDLQYSQTSQIIEDFYRLAGKRWNGKADDILALRAGEVGMRIMGNASAMPLEVLERLEKTAIDAGFSSNKSVLDELLFADFLEDLYGTSQTRSLRGQVSRAGQEGVGVIEKGIREGKKGMAWDVYKRLTQKTQQDQINAVRSLLLK